MMINDIKRIRSFSKEKQQKFCELLKKEGKKYGVYPITYQQRRFWRYFELSPDKGICNGIMELVFRDRIDEERILKTVALLLENEEILRTIYLPVDSEVFQVIRQETDEKIERYDLCSNAENALDEYQKLCFAEYNKPFDIANEIPFRAFLARISEDECRLCITMHHICFDGWALLIMKDDILGLYCNPDETIEKLKKRFSYSDYTLWQMKRIKEKDYLEKLEYLCSNIDGYNTYLYLDGEKKNASEDRFCGKTLVKMISPDYISEVKALAAELRVSDFSIFLMIYMFVMYLYSGQTSILTGFPSLNRENEDFSKVMGFCASVVAVRADIDEKATFKELLLKISDTLNAALERQEVVSEHIVEHCKNDICMPDEFFIDKCFSFQDAALFHVDTEQKLQVDGTEISYNMINFAEQTNMRYRLLMTVVESLNGFVLQMGYAYGVIPDTLAESFIQTVLDLFYYIFSNDKSNINRQVSEFAEEFRNEKKLD